MYLRIVNGLLKANKTGAVYWLKDGETLSPGLLLEADRWINSPVTDRLRAMSAKPSALYCGLLQHLLGVLSGEAKSLVLLPQFEAWSSLTSTAELAQSRFREAFELA